MTSPNATFETLVDTIYDSLEGYRKAAETAESPALKSILTKQAEKRQVTLDLLNAELARTGGSLVTKGTVSGELHQVWLKVTDLFENGDEAAVERVEEGEEYLAEKMEEALAGGTLDQETVPVVREALDQVRAGERLADQLEKQYD